MPETAPSAAPASSPAPPAPSSAPAAAASPPAAAPQSVTSLPKIPETSGTPSPAPAAEPPKLHRVKVNGEDREVEAAHVEALAKAFGLSPDEVLKLSGMASSSYERWKEAAKLRKEAEEAQKAAKARYEDPRITEIKATDPNLSDEDAWALLRVREMYERAQMNPDQRALAEERSKREALEKQAKEREAKEKETVQAAETKAQAAQLDRSLTEALTKHALPKNPAWARAVLDHMAAQVRAGEVPDVEASAIHVKRLVQGDDQARLGALSDEALEGWLGKALIDRILKRSVAKLQTGTPTPAPTPPQPTPTEPKSPFLSEDEWKAKYRTV